MNIIYDKQQDLLVLELSTKNHADIFPFETDNVAVEIDLDENRNDDEDIISVAIRNAKAVVAQILDTGIIDTLDTLPQEPEAEAGLIWYEANSSMITGFGYDSQERFLEVAFIKTGRYRYYEVPPEVVEDLKKADSMGRYLQGNIIDHYLSERLND